MDDVAKLLHSGQFLMDDIVYKYIKLPAAAVTPAAGILAEIGDAFLAIIVDEYEVSLLIADDDYEEFKHRLPGAVLSDSNYRLISFDLELEPTLVGFMAHISTALAEARISVIPMGAWSRDHFLVPEADADKALIILKSLTSGRSNA